MISINIKTKDGVDWFNGQFDSQKICDAWLAKAQAWPTFPPNAIVATSGSPTAEAAAAEQTAADQNTRLQQIKAVISATPGTLTNVQRDTILIHLVKRELGL